MTDLHAQIIKLHESTVEEEVKKDREQQNFTPWEKGMNNGEPLEANQGEQRRKRDEKSDDKESRECN